MLGFREFPRGLVAAWLREYRKHGMVRIYRFPDGSRAYQFDDRDGRAFSSNPYTIAIV